MDVDSSLIFLRGFGLIRNIVAILIVALVPLLIISE